MRAHKDGLSVAGERGTGRERNAGVLRYAQNDKAFVGVAAMYGLSLSLGANSLLISVAVHPPKQSLDGAPGVQLPKKHPGGRLDFCEVVCDLSCGKDKLSISTRAERLISCVEKAHSPAATQPICRCLHSAALRSRWIFVRFEEISAAEDVAAT